MEIVLVRRIGICFSAEGLDAYDEVAPRLAMGTDGSRLTWVRMSIIHNSNISRGPDLFQALFICFNC
jgi:hypothetical protein